MKYCKLCPKVIPKGSPFTDYCSEACEHKAVSVHGMNSGTRRKPNFFTILLLVLGGVVLIGVKNCNSDKKDTTIEQLSGRNDSIEHEEKYSSKETEIGQDNDTMNQVQNETRSNFTADSENSSNSDNESQPLSDTSNQSLQNNNFRMVQFQKHQEEIEKATEMLEQNKSIDEIELNTSLTRKEIRQLRRKLRRDN